MPEQVSSNREDAVHAHCQEVWRHYAGAAPTWRRVGMVSRRRIVRSASSGGGSGPRRDPGGVGAHDTVGWRLLSVHSSFREAGYGEPMTGSRTTRPVACVSTQMGQNRVEARVDGIDIFIEASHPLKDGPNVWAPPALLTAMKSGRGMDLAGLDLTSVSNMEVIQERFTTWWPAVFQRIALPAPSVGESRASAAGVGCFFSGGADSFYSVLRNRDRITHLIFVHGFDIALRDKELAERARSALRAAAIEVSIPLIEVTTNMREVNADLNWGVHAHGAALAAVAHSLSNTLGAVIIPGSYHQDDLILWGTRPDLDPYWSSGRLCVEHDSADVPRPVKLAGLGDDPTAMRHLRVCWENRNGAYNCGKCEKCIRTMINLYAAGALERCQTLPNSLQGRDVAKLTIRHGSDIFAEENLSALRGAPGGWKYAVALRSAVLRGRARVGVSRLKRRVLKRPSRLLGGSR